MTVLHSHQKAAAAGSHTCPPVTTGASLPLYETVNAFLAGKNADFGGDLPVFRLDPGILTAQLGADGAPVYARGANGYTLTTHGAGAVPCLRVFCQTARVPSRRQGWPNTAPDH